MGNPQCFPDRTATLLRSNIRRSLTQVAYSIYSVLGYSVVGLTEFTRPFSAVIALVAYYVSPSTHASYNIYVTAQPRAYMMLLIGPTLVVGSRPVHEPAGVHDWAAAEP